MWWRSGVVYEVYPRSFQDTDGDGVGDLRGVTDRLPYLARLGVDAIWLSPFYASPMRDFGYDITDHCDVDPLFGTLADFDALVARGARARPRGHPRLRPEPHLGPAPVVRRVALVARRARSATGTSGATRRPTAAAQQLARVFGGSAWEWDEATGQFYYHAFLPEQPDLNWRNPAVREAMFDVAAVLARPRRGRLPRSTRCASCSRTTQLRDNPPDAGLRGPAGPVRLADAARHDRPRRGPGDRRPRCARVDRRRTPDRVLIGEVYLPDRAARALLRRRRRRRAPAVQLPSDRRALGRRRRSPALVERYEAALPRGRLAELGARQPRPAARREPRRRGPGAGRGDAAAHAARHADALLRRRARHARRARPARARVGRRPRRPRPGAHADAVGRRRRGAGFTRRASSRGCRSRDAAR